MLAIFISEINAGYFQTVFVSSYKKLLQILVKPELMLNFC